jgi:OOP family OmpA-OmpF porin
MKHVVILGAAVALLGGCASTADQKPADTATATSTSDDAAKAAAAKAAADKAAAEKAAAEKAAAEKAAADKAAADAAKARSIAAAAPKTTTVKGTGLFDFNKSALRPDAKSALDSEVVAKKGDVKSVSSVAINGHADRLGSNEYNQKLSEKRAEVVKAYLVGKGVPANNVDTFGFGKTQPAQGVAKCEDSLGRKKLIECLQPHRRVEVELKGEAK